MSRHAAVALMGLIVLAGGCAETGKPSEPRRLQAQSAFEQGVADLRRGQLGSALTTLQQAVSLDPSVATYHNALGLVYLQLARPEVALGEFQRATAVDQDYAEGYLNAGVALAEMSRWDEAVLSYQRAIASPRLANPDVAHQNLGRALFFLGRYQEAEQALRFAIGLDPQMDAAYYTLGLVLVAQDRKEEAKAAFRRAGQLAPNSPVGQAAREVLKALGEGG